ncbi:MAG: hypothetical protein COV31_00060 [Candidatus Yanofskybacteria bacterium CG10_big_fil_rev_8_21_14_0_10_46_23]|uniref:ParB/Sulfiredoxin domain-containing protein n=1 Tax=Candidatus Yanofskybacteria bacterium CG10_big_fil_rev_8_21_14_0_10_46_23 TaxID=1975098 RepID=A0A2H0R518_9BACT|nr:MAG: hypothetical protein COV31_00060 [Candidatus Yanofskybacteria bacterium CG10_big_fil_rev_8_21_14_0_10_46_23]
MRNVKGELKFNSPAQEMHEPDKMVETTRIGGKIYEIDKLRSLAEKLPIRELPLDDVRDAVGEGHVYWIDRNGEPLAPFQIIHDWSVAQHNEDWKDHIDSITRANLDNPIWITKDGFVFDGIHRLTRAVIENKLTIKVKVFEEFPEAALQN